MTHYVNLGRGPEATADMKRRIAALKNEGADLTGVIDALWERNRAAVAGEGFTYEFADDEEFQQSALAF